MGLRDIGDTLPPGFRFYPSDEELICHYLYKKIANEETLRGTLVEVHLHTCEPWQLPDVAKLNSNEWYFFSFRDRKYATGFRTNRATTSGYWKATGKDRIILDPILKSIVGMRKTLVFYKNRAPNGIKTGWIMHEFRLENPHVPPKEDWVLCRVFHKSVRGETSNKFSPQNDINFDFASPTPPSNGNIYRNIPCNFSHNNTQSLDASLNPSTNVETLGLLSSRFDDHEIAPQHLLSCCSSLNNNNENKVDETCKNEDDYGFLFDLDSSSGPPMSRFDGDGIIGPGFM